MMARLILVLLFCTLAVIPVDAQSPQTPPPELKKWEMWIGDWALSGTAKDSPKAAEYKVDWQLHERWILGGFFVEVDQTWKGNGQELHALEILSYDVAKKVHTVTGFGSDGSTWSLTAKFEGATVIEDGSSMTPEGKITCRMTWVFSDGGAALSGKQECEQGGSRWTSIQVRGARMH